MNKFTVITFVILATAAVATAATKTPCQPTPEPITMLALIPGVAMFIRKRKQA